MAMPNPSLEGLERNWKRLQEEEPPSILYFHKKVDSGSIASKRRCSVNTIQHRNLAMQDQS